MLLEGSLAVGFCSLDKANGRIDAKSFQFGLAGSSSLNWSNAFDVV